MNSTTSHTNLDYLRLMADGDQEMEQTMLEMLITELSDEFEKMKTLHEQESWTELGRVAHKMKSTLAFIGNDEMTDANRAIEQSAKNGTGVERISDYIQVFGDRLPVVMEELRETLASY